MAEKLTQCTKILEHIKYQGSINPIEARELYGVMRLASRIKDLKRFGHDITSEIVTGVNRDGDRVRYAIYKLAQEGNHE
jgi:hypothetical protein